MPYGDALALTVDSVATKPIATLPPAALMRAQSRVLRYGLALCTVPYPHSYGTKFRMGIREGQNSRPDRLLLTVPCFASPAFY
jgi:hypothetical protein